jgi:hypothetical protein
MAIAGATLVEPSELLAQCEVQKLTASTAAAGAEFGSAVFVDGEVAAVGARFHDCDTGSGCGAAYVFRFNGSIWVQEQKLTASDAAAGDEFGSSVSVSGNRILVGAWLDDHAGGTDSGAAYVFQWDGSRWVQQQKLTASDADRFERYGLSVSVNGERVFVGSPGANCAAGPACGAVYAYRFDGARWVEEQKLLASDAHPLAVFGVSVQVDGDLAVVGDWRHDCAAAQDCGAAYVFRFDGLRWAQEQKLTASDASAFDGFGISVSVRGDLIIVGALWDDPMGSNSGAAYVYRFSGARWVQEGKLTAPDGASFDEFGRSVSVGRDVAVVGAWSHDCAAGSSCGSAYVYRFNGSGWQLAKTLAASDPRPVDLFGQSVSVSEDILFVGRPRRDCAVGTNCGAASVFALGPDCNANGEADFCDIRDGHSRDVDADGVPDECEVITAALDIKPGTCPNPFNPKSQGVLPVAVVGSPTFDVTQVDTATLSLRRSDGVGGSVRPLSGPPGPGIHFEDVATPFSGPECGCNELGADGIEDLTLKFSTPELVASLELGSLPAGASVALTVTGAMHDGTRFAASDCILLTGAAVSHRSVEVESEPSAIPEAPSRHSRAETVPIPVGRTDPKD